MKNTREKIVEAAQDLFNQYGIARVSIRSICEALQISVGNFTYYFPNKDKVIIELYGRMISTLEEIPRQLNIERENIMFLLELHLQKFRVQNDYRFFFLNTFELLTSYPEIKKVHNRHQAKERKMIGELFLLYKKRGVLISAVEQSFFEQLINVAQMVNTFWIVDAEVHYKGSERQKLHHYLLLCCSLIEPYLTPPALEEYKAFFRNLKVL